MTGMGKDGSREIGRVFKEGSVTLAQDENSSVVFGMPRVAIEHGYITEVVSLENMAGTINRLAGI
jgi:two-component system chemotaxis response regulator CheB